MLTNDLEIGYDPLAVTNHLHGKPDRPIEILASIVPTTPAAHHALGDHSRRRAQQPPLDGCGGDARIFHRRVFFGESERLDASRVLRIADNLDFGHVLAAKLRHHGMTGLVVGRQSKMIAGIAAHAVMVTQLRRVSLELPPHGPILHPSHPERVPQPRKRPIEGSVLARPGQPGGVPHGHLANRITLHPKQRR